MSKLMKAIPAAYLLKKLPKNSDDVLYSLGLQRRSSATMAVEAVAIFGAGCLVGAGLALLFAPRTGNELRADLSERANQLREKAKQSKYLGSSNAEMGSSNIAGMPGSHVRA